MPAQCLVNEGTVIEDFHTASEWSVSSSEAYTPADEFITLSGVGSVRLASKASTTVARMEKIISLDLSALATSIAKLDVHVRHDWPTTSSGGLVKVTVEFSSTTDYSKSFKYTSPHYLHGGWVRLTIAPGDWVNTGSESWSNTMVRMRVGFTCNASNSLITAHFDSFHIGWQTTPAVVVVLCDSYLGQYENALGILADYGVQASLRPNLMKLGTNGGTPTAERGDVSGWTTSHMSAAQLMEMYHAGHEVLIAAKQRDNNDHYTWRNRNDDVAIEDLNIARSELYGYGISPVELASPWGAGTHRIASLAQKLGFAFSFYEAAACEATPVVGSEVHWRGVSTPTSLGDVKGWVDAIEVNGGSLILYFFDIDDDGTYYYWPATSFDALLDYIINAKGIDIMPLSAWYAFASDVPSFKRNSSPANRFILGSLDLNNQLTYFVDNEGVNLGQPQTTWDEVPSYAASANAQVNVSRRGLIPVTLPMRVVGTSASDLRANLAALWNEVDKVSNTLIVGDETYDIVISSRPATIERDPLYVLGHTARFTLQLYRKP